MLPKPHLQLNNRSYDFGQSAAGWWRAPLCQQCLVQTVSAATWVRTLNYQPWFPRAGHIEMAATVACIFLSTITRSQCGRHPRSGPSQLKHTIEIRKTARDWQSHCSKPRSVTPMNMPTHIVSLIISGVLISRGDLCSNGSGTKPTYQDLSYGPFGLLC